MKNLRNLLLFIPLTFGIVSCNTDDLKNDIDDLKDRVSNLEAQVQILNENLNALRVLTQDDAKTIKEWSFDSETGKYTIKLSDGETISLTQGVKGRATTPDITIGEDGYWYIDGEKQPVKAEGSDAPTPEFRITSEGYWQVDLDGKEGTQYDFKDVTDENGNRVKATTSDSINMEDQFFKSVKEENGFLVVEVKGYDNPIKLPIDADLICEIVDPKEGFNKGVLSLGYGKFIDIIVKVKGDRYAVTAPAGWTAILGEPNPTTNEAVLTLTAPTKASTMSRAIADNFRDLTLQVNSGVNWAVDKIQVEAKDVIDSYYALYERGEVLKFGDVEISKAIYGDAVQINTADYAFTDKNKVYFIEPDVEIEWNTKVNFETLILIGDNSLKRSKLTPKKQLKVSDKNNPGNGFFFAYNIEINSTKVMTDDSDPKSTYLFAQNSDTSFGKVVFDNCRMIFTTQPLTYISTPARSISDFTISNTLLEFIPGTHQQYLISLGGSTATYPKINFINNIFYSKENNQNLQNFRLFRGEKATLGELVMHNNTFINMACSTEFYVYANIVNNIDVTKNIFYTDAQLPGNCGLIRCVKTYPVGRVCSDNIVYKISTNTWQAFYGGMKNGFAGAEEFKTLTDNPYEGGIFEPSSGTFIPNSTYADYGAKFE